MISLILILILIPILLIHFKNIKKRFFFVCLFSDHYAFQFSASGNCFLREEVRVEALKVGIPMGVHCRCELKLLDVSQMTML